MKTNIHIIAFAGLALVAVGCNTAVDPVVITAVDVDPRVDYSDLHTVLSRAVDGRGFLQSYEVDGVVDRLDAQLALFAVTGPSITPGLYPTAEDRLAYWFNARSAWAIKLAELIGCMEWASADLLEHRSFQLDGRMMTLAGIDEILSRDEDWRTVAAAPCVRLRRGGLTQSPFEPRTIRMEIRRRFIGYVSNRDRFVIDGERREVRYHPVIWQFRDVLIERYERTYGASDVNLNTAILPYLEGAALRRMQSAIGYRPVSDAAAGPLACAQEASPG